MSVRASMLCGVLRPGDGQRARRAELLGQTEVQHLDDVFARAARPEKQVLRLDVSVNDAERVRLGERLAHL
jgi:hypothetical protein